AIFLPDMIESSGGNTRRYYSLEIAGGLAALMLLPLLAMAGYRWVFGGYLLSFLAIAVLLSASARNLALLSAMVLLFLGSYDALDKNPSAWFYRHWYAGAGVTRIIHTTYSPYHKVEVASDRNEHPMLLLNSHAQFTHAGHANYSYFAAEFPASILGGRPRACLLGCGSMSTVGRIGAMVRWIDIVDIDRAVFEVSKMHFAAYNHLDHLRNWTFHADDAKHFLASGREEFDLIIDDIPPARTRQVALTYTKEFFQLVESRLASRGIFSLPSLVSVEAHDSYGRKIAATMRSVFDKVFILQRRGTSYLYGCNAGFTFDRPRLIRALNHWDKDNVRFLGPDKVDRLIEGTPVITVNNTAELIYD
ncbi:MAG: hypothetical protein ACE5HU_10240, partial [Acidobacteriota bacterium]